MTADRLKVGQRYNPRRASWPDGGVEWRFSPAGTELVLFLARPTASEVLGVRKGTAQFALTAGDHCLLLCYRFADAMAWSDQPWAAVRALPSEREVAGPAGLHLVVQVALVDATDGVVRALRQLTWPPRFADRVRAEVARLARSAGQPGEQERADLQVARWQRSSSAQLAATATVRCTGGSPS